MASSKIKFPSFYIPDSLHQLPSRYEFLDTLGEGTYGQVLKCWDKNEQRNVAIKIPKLYISDKEVGPFVDFNIHNRKKKVLLGENHKQSSKSCCQQSAS